MQRGFSLVELSIVLVILGLLTGGILTGQSLIRAAELRAVTTEYQRWITATQSFRDRYFALPGDMTNATSFWGAADTSGTDGACGASPHTYAGTGTQTCNGNGNGQIGLSLATSAMWNETHRFWQHLANAGLIEGSYTGIASGGTTMMGYTVGVNAPASKVGNACWSVWRERNPGEAAADGSGIIYGNLLSIGGATSYSCSSTTFSSEEAWNIDKKMDDGKPRQGSIIATYQSPCTNATSISDLNAVYTFERSSKSCTPNFVRAF